MPLSQSTTVSVYRVRSDGATGDRLGPGRLIEPRLVLAEPALAAALGALLRSPSARFRCGLTATVDETVHVEVIDARELHHTEDEDEVALSLEVASDLPPESAPWGPCDVLRPRPWFC